MAKEPALPMAPPCTLGSLANATAGMPPIWPSPASTPLSSAGSSNSSVPGSNSAPSLAIGSRPGWAAGWPPFSFPAGCRSWPAASRAAAPVCAWRARSAGRVSRMVTSGSLVGMGLTSSGSREDDRDIVPAESERVVDDGHRGATAPAQVGRLDRDLDAKILFGIIQVDRRRRRLLVQREYRGNRLYRPGTAEKMAGHRFGGRDHDGRGPERGGDRVRLDHVAGRRRGGVRVHVSYLLGRHAGVV